MESSHHGAIVVICNAALLVGAIKGRIGNESFVGMTRSTSRTQVQLAALLA